MTGGKIKFQDVLCMRRLKPQQFFDARMFVHMVPFWPSRRFDAYYKIRFSTFCTKIYQKPTNCQKETFGS